MIAIKKARIGSKHQITLPGRAVKRLGLGTGDYVEVRVREEKGIIELVPMAMVPKDQAWFWTPAWQAKEREAEKARAAGDYLEPREVEAVLKGLKKRRRKK